MTEALCVPIGEAARLLSCSARTIRRMLQRGALPGVVVGARVRVPMQALLRLVSPVGPSRARHDAAKARAEMLAGLAAVGRAP